MKKKLAGVLPIVHVPFEEDGTIDEKTLKKEIKRLYFTMACSKCKKREERNKCC
jgi:dihydrodipicolinate synthase/N-acetylneuraminate lyase